MHLPGPKAILPHFKGLQQTMEVLELVRKGHKNLFWKKAQGKLKTSKHKAK